MSNDLFVRTPSGIKKLRTIHRVADSCKGLPWNFEAASAKELPAEAQLRPAVFHVPYMDDPIDQRA